MRKYGTLLIIDDEQDIGDILTEIFEPVFEKVIYCNNAQEALGVLKATDLSVVLSDISMPGMTGHDLVVKMRSEGNLTPVIFVTGHASKDVVLSALRLGVSDVIEKPFEPENLTQIVDRVLEIEKRQRKLYQNTDAANAKKDQKMVGLLQVVHDSKKKIS